MLDLKIKNVSSLFVQVFEINTISYLKDNGKKVPEDIVLDGLVSSHEQTITYSQPSIIEHLQKYKLDFIKNFKRGVYVVNFLGDGVSSRAVLRRGKLRLIKEMTRKGYLCYIIDENGEICKEKNTGFYVNNEFFKADESGFIPYNFDKVKGGGLQKLVLCHDNYGYIVEDRFKSEKISIKADWLFDEETFLPGNKCSMILDLKYSINKVYMERKNMKSAKVTITFTKENGSTSEEVIEKVKIAEGTDPEINFYLPNKTTKVNLMTSVEYATIEKDDIAYSTSNKEILLLARRGEMAKEHIFLQKRNDGYYLAVKGKNGEPIAKVSLDLGIYCLWSWNEEFRKVITDVNGEVSLG